MEILAEIGPGVAAGAFRRAVIAPDRLPAEQTGETRRFERMLPADGE